ncbi:MAG TPA: sulfurtransferase [Microbacterium sp.]|nr:sulfurtransferase [Microbacterium sp.]
MDPLISAADLAALIDVGTPPRLVDVRFRLDKPDGRDDYEAGHIPGAAYSDLDHELAAIGEPSAGRHPLPAADIVQAALRLWGVQTGDAVVVYDGGTALAAARAWWILRGAGIDVRVLDGGLPAWIAAGGALETGSADPRPGDTVITEIPAGISIDEAAAWPSRGVLVDVRAAARYRGETEPLDPIAGHIPGAVNLPATGFFADDGTFRSPAELAAAFDAVGARADRPVAAYCGSGLTAAQAALAAAVAGREIEVYAGSWSAWSNTPGRPVATGSEAA